MQTITVAIADDDAGRRAKFELSLQGEQGVRVLASITINEENMVASRRLNTRTNITAIEEVIAATRWLHPRILLASLKQCTEADGAMLVSLRQECPETLVVLLTDESVQQEEHIMQALARGARGYLNPDADPILISKAVRVINRGEAWVPRKMLGKIMDHVLNATHLHPELANRSL